MPRGIGLSDISAASAATRYGRAMQIDILHGHGAKGGAYARLAARRLARFGRDVKAVYTPHGGSLHFDPRSPSGLVFMTLERRLLQHTAALLFESRFARDRFAERVGQPSCPVHVIHNGLTPEEFAPITPALDTTDILFIGELRELKGVRTLLQALAGLDTSPPVTATIVGDGPDRAAFEALSHELGLAGRVVFTGALPAREAFAKGRCLIVPSYAESLPYIVLEASAAAMPLIATQVGGIPEIVADSDTGLVPPANVTALADALHAALQDPAAARAKASRLRRILQDRFTVAGMAAQIEAAYYKAFSPAV